MRRSRRIKLVRRMQLFKPMSDVFRKVMDAIITNSNLNLTIRDCSTDFLQNPPWHRCLLIGIMLPDLMGICW
jgi:hypothetical protein